MMLTRLPPWGVFRADAAPKSISCTQHSTRVSNGAVRCRKDPATHVVRVGSREGQRRDDAHGHKAHLGHHCDNTRLGYQVRVGKAGWGGVGELQRHNLVPCSPPVTPRSQKTWAGSFMHHQTVTVALLFYVHGEVKSAQKVAQAMHHHECSNFDIDCSICHVVLPLCRRAVKMAERPGMQGMCQCRHASWR